MLARGEVPELLLLLPELRNAAAAVLARLLQLLPDQPLLLPCWLGLLLLLLCWLGVGGQCSSLLLSKQLLLLCWLWGRPSADAAEANAAAAVRCQSKCLCCCAV